MIFLDQSNYVYDQSNQSNITVVRWFNVDCPFFPRFVGDTVSSVASSCCQGVGHRSLWNKNRKTDTRKRISCVNQFKIFLSIVRHESYCQKSEKKRERYSMSIIFL